MRVSGFLIIALFVMVMTSDSRGGPGDDRYPCSNFIDENTASCGGYQVDEDDEEDAPADPKWLACVRSALIAAGFEEGQDKDFYTTENGVMCTNRKR